MGAPGCTHGCWVPSGPRHPSGPGAPSCIPAPISTGHPFVSPPSLPIPAALRHARELPASPRCCRSPHAAPRRAPASPTQPYPRSDHAVSVPTSTTLSMSAPCPCHAMPPCHIHGAASLLRPVLHAISMLRPPCCMPHTVTVPTLPPVPPPSPCCLPPHPHLPAPLCASLTASPTPHPSPTPVPPPSPRCLPPHTHLHAPPPIMPCPPLT